MKIVPHPGRPPDIVFSSGKLLAVRQGVIGLSFKGHVHDGYDGTIWHPKIIDHDYGLNTAECVELADYMIQQWQAFRLKHQTSLIIQALRLHRRKGKVQR